MIRIGPDVALLRLQHGLVLIEGTADAFADVVGELLVVEFELANDRPKIMRRCLCFRRKQVEHLALERSASVISSGWRGAVFDDVKSGRSEMIGMPAIYTTGEAGGALVEGRGFHVEHVAVGANHIAVQSH